MCALHIDALSKCSGKYATTHPPKVHIPRAAPAAIPALTNHSLQEIKNVGWDACLPPQRSHSWERGLRCKVNGCQEGEEALRDPGGEGGGEADGSGAPTCHSQGARGMGGGEVNEFVNYP
jgi:hypothetical protein